MPESGARSTGLQVSLGGGASAGNSNPAGSVAYKGRMLGCVHSPPHSKQLTKACPLVVKGGTVVAAWTSGEEVSEAKERTRTAAKKLGSS